MRCKIIFAVLAVTLVFVAVPPSFSFTIPGGYREPDRREATEPHHIAMLFYRLAGYRPNFEAWVQETEEYQRLSELEQDYYLEEQMDYLLSYFMNIDTERPIVVNMRTTMSAYSQQHGGFFIEAFRPDLFFSYEYMGNRFAVIPTDIDAYQWYEAAAEELRDIGIELTAETEIQAQIMVIPEAADAREPAMLGEHHHWVISGPVREVQVWTAGGESFLWAAERVGVRANPLLNLYR
ncbi:MAG: hypothetical protein EA357_10370 [Micavibrio sp.]|nr:MAG: hypothetical protein EA357_10370 [Micavibrio sp.]